MYGLKFLQHSFFFVPRELFVIANVLLILWAASIVYHHASGARVRCEFVRMNSNALFPNIEIDHSKLKVFFVAV